MSRRPRPVLRNRPKRQPAAAECEFCGRSTALATLRWVRVHGVTYPACPRCAATEGATPKEEA